MRTAQGSSCSCFARPVVLPHVPEGDAMCSTVCMHTHTRALASVTLPPKRRASQPACDTPACLRMRQAGDACDFAPLERLHCDLVVMLWRQDDLSASDARRWAERAQRLGDAGRAVLVLEALTLTAGTIEVSAAGREVVGAEAAGLREEALTLSIEAMRAAGGKAAGADALVLTIEDMGVAGVEAVGLPTAAPVAAPIAVPAAAPAPDLSRLIAEASEAAVAAGGGGRVDVFSVAELEDLYPWRCHTRSAAAGGGTVAGGGVRAGRVEVARRRQAAALSTLAVRRCVACRLGETSPTLTLTPTPVLTLTRCVACRLGETLKVYVADCDGTLWGGAVSEESVHGITFEAPHLALQAAMGRL